MNKKQILAILRRPTHLPLIPKIRPERIVESILVHHPNYSDEEQEKVTEKIQRAVGVASSAHSGILRKSGEPYIIHPFTVAFYLAEIGMDVDGVIAGLLHDTVEDTSTTIEEIQNLFGDSVAKLVDAVTKMTKMNINREEKQAHAFQKLMTFAADDVRVIFIKLMDRLHNMSTLDAMSEDSRKRISDETLRFYAPLAHRLGLYWLKEELEAFGFYFALREEWNKIDHFFNTHFTNVDDTLSLLHTEVALAIETHKKEQPDNWNIVYELSGRIKSYYSIYQKTRQTNKSYASIHDLLGIRIILEDAHKQDCYAVMGILHSYPEFHLVSNLFKDYISRPKENGYMSIHTVLRHRKYFFEAQIRTREMHQFSEGDDASHWSYKNGISPEDRTTQWLNRILKDLTESEGAINFMHDIEYVLPVDKISIFTPKGDIITLPEKATLLDFAFAIHGEVGSHCVGGIVNGTKRPLSHPLQNKDDITIDTEKTQHPHPDWLKIIVTTKARTHIKRFLKKQNRSIFIQQGRAMMKSLFATLNKSAICDKFENEPIFAKIKDQFSLSGDAPLDNFCYQLATGEIKFRKVIKMLFDPDDIAILVKAFPQRVGQLFPEFMPEKKKKATNTPTLNPPIYINGIGVLREYGIPKCCSPVEGDAVVAYISPTRGYIVHKKECSLLKKRDQKRIEHNVFWYQYTLYTIDLIIELVNAVGAMQEVMTEIAAQEFSIKTLHLNPDQLQSERGFLYVTVRGTNINSVDLLQKGLKKKKKILSFAIDSIRID